ncbi:hypothetical protein [Streptomyces sp. TRM72054]|uniref:hypothetical protein n=1 Tax=Streptomyces sp. TRM72054 TaxID=2870562 RepID=UPI0021AB2776
MTNNLNTLATALYVATDGLLKEQPYLALWRPAVGIAPRLSDAELLTLAMMQAMLGFTSEVKWLRHARAHVRHLFPLPASSPATTNGCARLPGYCSRSPASLPPPPPCLTKSPTTVPRAASDITNRLAVLRDPRDRRGRLHSLVAALLTACCAVLVGACSYHTINGRSELLPGVPGPGTLP